MIFMLRFIFYWFIVLLSACQIKNDTFDLEFTQKSIFLNGKGQELYLGYQLSLSKGKHILVGFDGARNTVDFFDVEKGILLKSVSFDEDGPNGIGKLQKVFYFNEKRIFFYNGYHLIETDIEGNIQKKILLWKKNPSIDEKFVDDDNPISFPPYFPFIYRETDGNIYYARTLYVDQMIHDLFNSKTSIIGRLNWQNDNIEDLPIYFPKFLLQKDKYFGLMYHPQLTFWKDKLVINYTPFSEIFVHNLEGKFLNKYNALSSKTSNRISGLPIASKNNFDKVFKNFYKGPKFYSLHYDPINKVFYRFHDVKELDNQGKILQRNIYLMIMNENFEVIQEEKMPETINNPTLCLVLPEGGLLVGVAGDQIREDHLTYNLIKLKKLKE